ncbi:MAG: hypothetical protein HUK26_07640, partial [Duodenibacillus sp.]|nr:hypothetical protein [Duodenibacillus sp.]
RNDAPSGNADATLGNITEQVPGATYAGKTVDELFAGNFSDEWIGAKADGKGDKFNEHADYLDTFGGIIITGNAAAADQGVWQYSADGSSWTDIGAVDVEHGLVLAAGTSVRFVPADDFFGEPGGLQGYVFETGSDEVYGLTAAWATGDTVNAAVRGETLVEATGREHETCISDTLSTLTVYVDPVNDAPEIDLEKGGDATVLGVLEDSEPSKANAKKASELFERYFKDTKDGTLADSFYGVMAVNPVDDPLVGHWVVSYDDGATWETIVDGMFIGKDDLVSFEPARVGDPGVTADFNGRGPDLTVRLIETNIIEVEGQTEDHSADVYDAGTKLVKADAEIGGKGCISADTVSAKVAVEAINDAPTFKTADHDVVLAEGSEDEPTPGVTIESIILEKFQDIRDDVAKDPVYGTKDDSFWG